MKRILFIVINLFLSGVYAQDFNWAIHYEAQTLSTNSRFGNSSIVVDKQKNVYSLFQLASGEVNFSPASTPTILSSVNGQMILQKVDSAGNFLWAKQWGTGVDGEYISSVVLDSLDNIYIGGVFSHTIDVDPSPAIQNFVPVKTYDGFILKLDSAGNFIWAKQIPLQNYDPFDLLDSSNKCNYRTY